ncbi:MAG: hypothetical protein WBB45_05210 [Cyclobacteriaceae bacterium]
MKNELLRHIISTIRYRFDKSVRGSKEAFADFSLGRESRSPAEIVHHMYDVIYSTRVFIEQESLPAGEIQLLGFEDEIDRFNLELGKIDRLLEERSLDINYSKRLVQGPFSDVLTHIGQLAMLQRLTGNPIDGEDFSGSNIKTGLND